MRPDTSPARGMQSLKPHAERKMNLRWSAFRGIRKVIETGGHETGRIRLSHRGVHCIPVEPLERIVVIEPKLRLEPLLDREVLIDRSVGPYDTLRDPEVIGHVAARERRSYYFAQVAPSRSIRLDDRGRAAVSHKRVLRVLD